jgi:hypothetical protein
MLRRLTDVLRAMEVMPKTRMQMMVPTYWPESREGEKCRTLNPLSLCPVWSSLLFVWQTAA